MLAQKGAKLSLADVDDERLAETAALLANPSAHTTHRVNVAMTSDVDTWIAKTIERYGRLDGAANWAGVARANPIEEETDENWDFVMGINAKGVFNCIRAQLRAMKDGAAIVRLLRVSFTPSSWTSSIGPVRYAQMWCTDIILGFGNQCRWPNRLAESLVILCE